MERKIIVPAYDFNSVQMSSLLGGCSDAVLEFEWPERSAANMHIDQVRHLDVVGTQTLIEFNKRFYSILTSHQLRKLQSGVPRIALPGRNASMIGPPSLIDFSKAYRGIIDHTYDLCVSDYTDLVKAGWLPTERFFPIDFGNVLASGEPVFVASNLGFPKAAQHFSSDCEYQTIDGIEVPEYTMTGIHLNPIINTLKLMNSFTDQDEDVQWQHFPAAEEDPNGRSGSPIFAFTPFGGLLRVKFAGIVYLGGGDKVTAYTGPTIVNVLKKAEVIFRLS